MPHLPQPCPRCELGTLEIAPYVETKIEIEIHQGVEYETNATITCDLIADCDTCDFVKIVAHDTRYATFDQFYYLSESTEPDPQFLADMEEMNQLYEEGSYA